MNVGHDTTIGSNGEIVPKISWQSEETNVAGFDVKVSSDYMVVVEANADQK